MAEQFPKRLPMPIEKSAPMPSPPVAVCRRLPVCLATNGQLRRLGPYSHRFRVRNASSRRGVEISIAPWVAGLAERTTGVGGRSLDRTRHQGQLGGLTRFADVLAAPGVGAESLDHLVDR